MDLYIDKENLRSLIKAKDRDEYPDCLRMMKRQLHLVYNIDKTSLKNDPELMQWVMKASEGRGDSEEKDTFRHEIFPIRPIKSNTCDVWNREQLSSVYLIDDLDCKKLKGRVLIGEEIGEEVDVLSHLFCGMDYDFHHLYDLKKNFNSWEQLTMDNQMLPCTDIILNDRYFFNHDCDLVECNLSLLFGTLVKNVSNLVNIVIFTRHNEALSFGIEKAEGIIKDKVNSITGIMPNVTFVTGKKNSYIFHDRFIITNYRLIRSGSTFIYFDTEGRKITRGGSLDIDSLANRETYTYVGSLLEGLQRNIDKIYKHNKDMIIGDKVSNFVRFEK